jgi:DNA-binding HxlR family transcriptional regulator
VKGISSRVLTERLRALEEKGFVYRDYKPSIPPAVTYGLTKRMNDIRKILRELDALARKWQQEEVPPQRRHATSGPKARTTLSFSPPDKDAK